MVAPHAIIFIEFLQMEKIANYIIYNMNIENLMQTFENLLLQQNS